ncbi:MAG: peptide ABC transporter substrate-binding protein [Steroidobacteraceae bacterium]|jgi:oligopeptide transport system substrate-binding protein|nr:peptide ABC transporter substrate-binding protein [Steroidobacteraceae bacterium]
MKAWAWTALLAVAVAAVFGLWRLQAGTAGGDAPPPPGLLRLERGNGSEPDSLDPQLARMESALTILRDAYEGLTSIAPDGGVRPGAAESWAISEDGRRYTFRLRPAARWSNGDPVTAADFVEAWRRLVDPATASQYAAMLEPVAGARAVLAREAPPGTLGVTAPDDRTLEVTLEAPTAYFLSLLSHPSTFPVHRPTLAARGAEFARPGVAVTNGAFVPVDWQVGAHVTARRNRQYWDDAGTALDAVRYHHVSDPVVELTRFRAGELDVTYTLPPGEVARQRARGATGLHVSPQLGVYYYGLALDRPPFDAGPAIRRALAMAIDRQILAERVLGDGEMAAFGWVPPGVAGYEPARFEWADWPAERRLEEARRLYREAGYSAERPLSIELRFNKSPLHDRLALAVSAMWKEALGVETRLAAEEFRVLRQSIDARNVQVFRGSWVADYNDAHSFLQVLEGGFGINLPRYASADYDTLLARSRTTTDPAARAAILADAERVMLADVPLIPLFFYVSKHLVAGRVEGWYDNVMNVTYSKDLGLRRP